MKFTKTFMDTLRVFSGVNQNMFFREGFIQTSCVNTKAGALTFFVRAKTDVEIEKSFGIGSLRKFLGALDLFSEPEITMTDKGSLLIAEEGKYVTYRLTSPDFLTYNKDPDKAQVSVGCEAALTEEQTINVLNMYAVFDAKYISFVGKEGDFLVNVHSGEDVNFSNNGTMVIGKTDETFNATFAANLFHLPKGAYKVVVSRKGYVYFANDIYEYFIPADSNHSVLQ
jgi:hypothetical protein